MSMDWRLKLMTEFRPRSAMGWVCFKISGSAMGWICFKISGSGGWDEKETDPVDLDPDPLGSKSEH